MRRITTTLKSQWKECQKWVAEVHFGGYKCMHELFSRLFGEGASNGTNIRKMVIAGPTNCIDLLLSIQNANRRGPPGLWRNQIFVCLLHTHGKHQMVAGHQLQEGKTQSLRSCCHWVWAYWRSSNPLCFARTPRVFSSSQIERPSFQGRTRCTTDNHQHTGVYRFQPPRWCHAGDWCKGWTVQVRARTLGGRRTGLWHLRRHHD